jgi:putative heme-binding domain-containing protein
MELDFGTDLPRTNLIEARPQHDTFGIPDAMLVAPGQPDRSVLLHRLSCRGPGQMPPLVTTVVDQAAVSLFREWIAQMKSERKFVRDWRMVDLQPSLAKLAQARSFESGKKAFHETGCVQCHRLGREGGTVGPDLTGIHQRMNLHQMLESIIEPSKVIAEAYAGVLLQSVDGRIISGRIESEDAESLVVTVNPLTRETVRLSKSAIVERSVSKSSNMPAGILNSLDEQQILNLLAYLQADGKVERFNLTTPEVESR